MNVPLLVAGSLALIGAAIHGLGGEVLVVRRLSPGGLPSSPFGGPRTTKAMIRATWHLTTIAFATVGFALVLAGSILQGDIARGIALVGAGASTAFAAVVVAVGLPQLRRRRHQGILHPGPAILTAVAVLAWVGVAG